MMTAQLTAKELGKMQNLKYSNTDNEIKVQEALKNPNFENPLYTIEPDHSINIYAIGLEKSNNYINDEHKAIVNNMLNVLHNNINARVFHLDKDIIPLMLNTNNTIFKREIPFVSFFINNDIDIPQTNIRIKGIFISKEMSQNINPSDDFMIFLMFLNKKTPFNYYKYTSFLVEDKNKFMPSTTLPSNKEEMTGEKLVNKFTKNFVCNFLDLLNNKEDIEIVNISYQQNN